MAFDPVGGALYLTEDDRNQAGFYKFVPQDRSARLGSLARGGTLYMARVAGQEKADLLDPQMGDSHRIEWVEIAEPDQFAAVLHAATRFPTAYHRVRVRGRRKAESFRASAVYPRLVDDLLNDLRVFGTARAAAS